MTISQFKCRRYFIPVKVGPISCTCLYAFFSLQYPWQLTIMTILRFPLWYARVFLRCIYLDKYIYEEETTQCRSTYKKKHSVASFIKLKKLEYSWDKVAHFNIEALFVQNVFVIWCTSVMGLWPKVGIIFQILSLDSIPTEKSVECRTRHSTCLFPQF